jgi:hypothetical protein
VVHLEAEVLAEEAGQPAQRQEDGGDDRQLLQDDVEPVRDGGQVDVHRAREQVAVRVDQIADPDQVVVDVAEVPLVLGRHARQRRDAADQARKHVAFGCHSFAQADEQTLHLEDLLELLVACVQERLVLQLVDAVVEVGEDREEAVSERVDDLVEQSCRLVERRPALGEPVAHLGEGGRLVAVDGDEVALAVEAMHLDEAVLVG